ncbi:class I SAM-dependent methyltransferase [Candidatus Clostridium radicumherbarum]|uniref:Class I SAM-dependent methyltransferase n=1 Tax=Candidatus Clostridium radicumherbarum TaxID=3381662 RepID=A0ABW8TUS9_9CLOT
MSQSIWNERLEFLKAIRTGWCNDDYIEFLVEKVWKIRKPVNIIDFGCGFGYVGLLLLPILPKGSTYTGIDISDTLLDDAKYVFKDSEYNTKFIKADLNEYAPTESYDIAISQAVLRHIPNGKNILEKMIQSVVRNGLVVCMEGDLEIEKTGQYFSGLDYIELGMIPLHRKMYKKELEDGGRDYRLAIKIPIYMQELGLHDIGVRMNDRVKFINPHGNEQEHAKHFDAMATAWGWNKQLSENKRIDYINSLINRGLSKQEAMKYVDGESKIGEYVMSNKDSAYIIQAPCTLISYGIK